MIIWDYKAVLQGAVFSKISLTLAVSKDLRAPSAQAVNLACDDKAGGAGFEHDFSSAAVLVFDADTDITLLR